MALDPEQLARLQRAYEVLGLPQTASAQQVKQAYRKLTKRWHPDLYSPGSFEQKEATLMMKVINDAYDFVSGAPLNDCDPRVAAPEAERVRQPYVQPPRPIIFRHDRDAPPPKLDLFGFWVRFFFGAIFGLLCGFNAIARGVVESIPLAILVGLAEVVIFGLLSGFLGDKFWIDFFRR
ncbi:heat shock protein DnaJ-like protein [Candidatus Koribacter versatilis Ellin345]|uniref:Heat shock protein DnaJ-like protein n=1 Tax=Koribacter versatilis (strain Ellin345) TaxID=204669 RepID=Q1IRR9_KORVE|nr:J domain-containing protein [Candidatus Koribacter versatilis]ABF40431.1 heat shock protein DnaJ-like protein [Candidatus Koribacter versatilis Ellin345]